MSNPNVITETKTTHITNIEPLLTGLGCMLGAFVVGRSRVDIAGGIIGGFIGFKLGEFVDSSVYVRTITTVSQDRPATTEAATETATEATTGTNTREESGENINRID